MNAPLHHHLLLPVFCVCKCVCTCETCGVLQDNTEHPAHAWLMSGAIVAVPAGQMKRHESTGRLRGAVQAADSVVSSDSSIVTEQTFNTEMK